MLSLQSVTLEIHRLFVRPCPYGDERAEERSSGRRCCQKLKASLHSRGWLFWLLRGSMVMVEKVVVMVVLTGEQGRHSEFSCT